MKKDGGAAFPRSDGGYSATQDGMGLRDWLAGQALAGLCAAMGPEYRPSRVIDMDGTATDAYAMADAMLEEREKD